MRLENHGVEGADKSYGGSFMCTRQGPPVNNPGPGEQAEHTFERVEGLLSWGRTYGGNAYAPNTHVEFVRNVFVEGNHLWNYNGSYPYGYEPLGPASKTAEPFWMGVLGGGQGPGCPFQGAINHNLVFRSNKLLRWENAPFSSPLLFPSFSFSFSLFPGGGGVPDRARGYLCARPQLGKMPL